MTWGLYVALRHAVAGLELPRPDIGRLREVGHLLVQEAVAAGRA